MFAFAIAVPEFFSVLGHSRPSAGEIQDAAFSAALAYALYATIFMLSGLIPGNGARRRVYLVAFHSLVAVMGTLLFTSWFARWLLGQPLTGDATRVLMESPAASILHLRDSEALLLAVFGVCLLLFLYVSARMLHLAASAWANDGFTLRACGGGALALGAALLSWRTANADLTWSSFAPVLSSQGVVEALPPTYSCERSPPVLKAPMPSGSGNGTPVIVIVLESLRGDILRKYPEAMPFLSGLAHETVVFDKAYAAATHSDFADIALWYSRHALYADGRRGFPQGAAWRGTSAFEYFSAHGYRTGYFSSQDERWGGMINWMKTDAVGTFIDAWNHVDLDHLDAETSARLVRRVSAEHTDTGKVLDQRTLELAAEWLGRRQDETFFLGLNLQNSHFPYVIPAGGAEPFEPYEKNVGDSLYSWPPERTEWIRNRYLNSVFNMDVLLASFAQRLREIGVWDKSIILFIGDHGEAFHEHGYASHGGAAFDEIARPLAVLKLPKGHPRSGTAFEHPVSSIDFIPLLAELTGLPQWDGFQGRSPFTSAPGGPIFITVNGITRENDVVRWPWKFMSRTFPEGSLALYHLQDDPEEKHDLVREHPAVAASLSAEVNTWRKCQVSYYTDKAAYTRLQPPRFH